jgi:hypothetical protein
VSPTVGALGCRSGGCGWERLGRLGGLGEEAGGDVL